MFNNSEWLNLIEQADNCKSTELAQQLLGVALNGQHKSPEFIKSFNGLKAAREISRGLTKLAQGFRNSAAELYTRYILRLSTEKVDEVNLLYHHKIFLQCADFYEKENMLVRDAIHEYETYLSFGHTMSAILGEERKWEDLYDFRTGEKTLPTLEDILIYG